MLLGVGEWGFRELPFEEHCRISSELGFKYMEIGIGGDCVGRIKPTINNKEIQFLLDCIKDYKLQTPFCCLENDFTISDPELLNDSVNKISEEIKLAKEFGVTHVRLFTGFTPINSMTDEQWDRMLKAFREVDKLCKKLNIEIAIETHGRLVPKGNGVIHQSTTSTDWDALVRLLDELPETIGFNFDPGNLRPIIEKNKKDLLEYVMLLNPRINYCHLKDWIPHEDGSWTACAIGDTDYDWKRILEAMKFDGVYLIEYEPTNDVEDGIKRSIDYLQIICGDVVFS